MSTQKNGKCRFSRLSGRVIQKTFTHMYYGVFQTFWSEKKNGDPTVRKGGILKFLRKSPNSESDFFLSKDEIQS